MFKRVLTVTSAFAFALAFIALSTLPARAGLVFSVANQVNAAGDTATVSFDVVITNTGASAVNVGFFDIQVNLVNLNGSFSFNGVQPNAGIARATNVIPQSGYRGTAGDNYLLFDKGEAGLANKPAFMTAQGAGFRIRDGFSVPNGVQQPNPGAAPYSLAANESKLIAKLLVTPNAITTAANQFRIDIAALSGAADPFRDSTFPLGQTIPNGPTNFTGAADIFVNDPNGANNYVVIDYNLQAPANGGLGFSPGNFTYFSAVPEPSTYAMMGLALTGLAIAKRFRKKSAK